LDEIDDCDSMVSSWRLSAFPGSGGSGGGRVARMTLTGL